jgi:RNA polymerase sigma-54 factor
MELSNKLEIKQTNKLTLNQQLVQSIEMLQLSNMELAEKISFELVENPVLEEESTVSVQTSDESDIELLASVGKELSGDDTVLQRDEEWSRDSAVTSYDACDGDRKRNFIENAVAQRESLKEHLISQANIIAKDQTELSLLVDIITSLNDNGFLTTTPEIIAEENSIEIKKIIDAIGIVNSLDPVGCGASCIRDSLLIQARHIYPDDEILLRILEDHFTDLEKLDYGKIANSLHITPGEIIKKSRLIQNLDPFPGVKYSLKKTRFIIPDIEVKLIDGEIFVGINDDWIPKIRINSYYGSLLKKKTIDNKLALYIRDKIYSANHLLRSISTRRETIIKVVTAIMEHQRDFLIHGAGHLRPLVYTDIAIEVGLHESTVGRVANNKFVQTPWGIFEVKYFFVSRLKSKNCEEHSSEEVMNLIKEIVAGEDPAKPVSDSEIWKKLQAGGINIARRTISKYRSVLNISSSNVRKKINLIKSEDKK